MFGQQQAGEIAGKMPKILRRYFEKIPVLGRSYRYRFRKRGEYFRRAQIASNGDFQYFPHVPRAREAIAHMLVESLEAIQVFPDGTDMPGSFEGVGGFVVDFLKIRNAPGEFSYSEKTQVIFDDFAGGNVGKQVSVFHDDIPTVFLFEQFLYLVQNRYRRFREVPLTPGGHHVQKRNVRLRVERESNRFGKRHAEPLVFVEDIAMHAVRDQECPDQLQVEIFEFGSVIQYGADRVFHGFLIIQYEPGDIGGQFGKRIDFLENDRSSPGHQSDDIPGESIEISNFEFVEMGKYLVGFPLYHPIDSELRGIRSGNRNGLIEQGDSRLAENAEHLHPFVLRK
jgi:hypothetical protein